VHAVDIGMDPKRRIYYPNYLKCRAKKNTGHETEWFGINKCYDKKKGDETGFIQLQQ
jgi:hypothetical protein